MILLTYFSSDIFNISESYFYQHKNTQNTFKTLYHICVNRSIIYSYSKPHLPQNLEGGGFMTVSIEFDSSLITLLASIITIVLFLIQVLHFFYKSLLALYKKIIHRIAEDVAADINGDAKKDEGYNPVEKADHDTHSKGG